MNIPVDKRLGMLKTSAVAAACLTLMSFLVACGGGAGSANSSSWEKAITPPKLTGISPASGPTTGGTTVTTTGTDIQKGASVLFGNVPAAKINSVTSTSIEAVTPVHDPGNVDVKVTNPDTGSDTLLAAFAFEGSPPPIVGPAPTISSVLPNSGPVVGGTVVTITGTDFQSGATVTFGQNPAAAVVFSSATQLLATTRPYAPGPVDVIVRNPDTQSARVSGGFTYQPVPAPTIISILPTSGPEGGGTLVTVWGTNFLAGATVSFGGVAAASVTVTSATQLGAVTPPHAAGVVDVRVTNLDDQFATLVGAFTYGTPPPTILSVAPSSGTTAGGTPVTITGTGFQPAVPDTMVTFGSVAASGVNVISSTQIHAMTPAHDAGSVDVRVANPDTQSATRVGGYVYVSGTAPTISSLSVDSGLSSGGTPVTITGSNFAGGATVTFGTLPAASVTVVSPTRIDVTTPSQAAGSIVDVTVTNPDTQQGTLPNAFRYGQIFFQSGFETGDFSAWTSTSASGVTINSNASYVHSGTYSARIHYKICGKPIVAPSLSQTAGGSLGATTYYVKETNTNALGETAASVATESSLAVSANNLLVVASPPAMVDITGWNVYVGTSAGTETLQNVSPIAIGTNWTEPTGGLIAGSAQPTEDTACCGPPGCPSPYYSQDTNRIITKEFATQPGIGHVFLRYYIYWKTPESDVLAIPPHYVGKKSLYIRDCNGYNCGWQPIFAVMENPANGHLGVTWGYQGNQAIHGNQSFVLYGEGNELGNNPSAYLGVYDFLFDQWYAVEIEMKDKNDGTDPIVRYWVNGTLVFQKTGNWSDVHTTNPCFEDYVPCYPWPYVYTTGMYALDLGAQTNRYYEDAINEYRYFDDVVIADAYIAP